MAVLSNVLAFGHPYRGDLGPPGSLRLTGSGVLYPDPSQLVPQRRRLVGDSAVQECGRLCLREVTIVLKEMEHSWLTTA